MNGVVGVGAGVLSDGILVFSEHLGRNYRRFCCFGIYVLVGVGRRRRTSKIPSDRDECYERNETVTCVAYRKLLWIE